MNGLSRQLDEVRLWQLIEGACNETLDDGNVEELDAMLDNSEVARHEFVDAVMLHIELRDLFLSGKPPTLEGPT